MNTTAINYKDVFQLAESKGFRSEIESIDYRSLPDNETLNLLYATQIQKWLRDKHKIYIEPFFAHHWDCKLISISKNDYIGHCGKSDSYELALLDGINEALQLI